MTKAHLLFVPLMGLFLVLNGLGGIVSGIWLAMRGEWWAIGVGFVGLVVSHWVISLLLMPGMLLGLPALALLQKGRWRLASVFGVFSSLYTSAFVAAWGVGILLFFAHRATRDSAAPLLLWSYGVGTGPWAFLATKDQQAGGNEYSSMSAFFLQVGYVAAVIALLAGASFLATGWIVGAAMAINWLIQVFIMYAQLRDEVTRAQPWP